MRARYLIRVDSMDGSVFQVESVNVDKFELVREEREEADFTVLMLLAT